MMNYEEFKDEVKESIKGFLPPEYENADVRISQVIKNNGMELDALQIRKEGETITPSIYLNDIYKNYEKSGDFDSLMQQIAEIRVSADRETLPVSLVDITSFDKIKDRIDCRLLNMEKNEEYLKDRPFTQVEDLAVVYSIDLGKRGADEKMSTVITDNLLGQWGISTEDLHTVAMENLEHADSKFMSMRDTIVALMFPDMEPDDPALDMMLPPMDPDKVMYVLTSDDKMYGAKLLLDTAKMDEIAEKLEGDFIVLPSSIHESIILPNAAGISRDELEEIVQSVNSTVLDPKDFLSDNVYCYDAKEHELLRADRYEERLAERNNEKALATAVGEPEVAYGTALGNRDKRKDNETKAVPPKKHDNRGGRVSIREQIAEKKAILEQQKTEKSVPVKHHKTEIEK